MLASLPMESLQEDGNDSNAKPLSTTSSIATIGKPPAKKKQKTDTLKKAESSSEKDHPIDAELRSVTLNMIHERDIGKTC